jgi:hypothetical protein
MGLCNDENRRSPDAYELMRKKRFQRKIMLATGCCGYDGLTGVNDTYGCWYRRDKNTTEVSRQQLNMQVNTFTSQPFSSML